MDTFIKQYEAFLSDFGEGRTMVLSTSENDVVSSRMMSVVQLNGIFYFQTDVMLKKYRQLSVNPNAALCIDNIQLEGVCENLGHTLENEEFCSIFKKCFKGSYEAYTALKNERLFAFKPRYIERWVYRQGIPYIESFDIEAKAYHIERYSGE